MKTGILLLTGCALLSPAAASAQSAVITYRLGRDTMAVEQLTRTANSLNGEVVSRMGAAVTRTQYEVTLANGRPTAVVYRVRNAAGAPLPNQPREIRLTFVGDSVRRVATFADSTNTRMLPATRAIPFVAPAYGLYEAAFAQMRADRSTTATFASVGTGAGNPAAITFTTGGGDTIRTTNAIGLTTIFRVDPQGRLVAFDATTTTQKLVGTRSAGSLDIAALAARMTPAGTLSQRGNANASFLQSVVFVSYGRPQVRERTVWGGELVPFDQVWRTGANEATHLANARELTFGDVVVPPGLYTLWIVNMRSGPVLAINRQVGQWGTVYDQSRDVGRVPLQFAPTPEHVEEFTINIRNLGMNRGAIDFAWGAQMATASFTVKP